MTILNRDFSKDEGKAIAWAIAGSDCSGGAGIQADNKSFSSFGVFGCNIVTAVTAQNSQSVSDVLAMPAEQINSQWQALASEYPAKAIKLGMLANSEVIDKLITLLPETQAQVVCDPVLIATNGGSLMESSESYLKLLPHVDLITPNEEEFAVLFNAQDYSAEQLVEKAKQVAKQYHIDIVITDGESRLDPNWASDCCVIDGEVFWMHSPKKESLHTHGTGCSFSSALAAALALGYSRYEACVLAKTYINQGLSLPDFFHHGASGFQHTRFPYQLDKLPFVSHAHAVAPLTFPRCDTDELGLYPVVESLDVLQDCLDCGVKTIQLRIKDKNDEQLENTIEKAVAIGNIHQARLFINDHWQLAIKHKAYGVHLGQDDIKTADLSAIAAAGLHLGLSTHSWYEIAVAHSFKPSYIAIGPIYPTTTKEMPFAPQGLLQLQQWQKLLSDSYPLVAIGGIDSNNAAEVLATGVGSIAVVRAVVNAKDRIQAIEHLQDIIENSKQ